VASAVVSKIKFSHWLTWVLLGLFSLLVLSSTGAQLHGRLLVLGDWFFGDYYLVRGDLPAPTCNPTPDIEQRLNQLQNEAQESSDLDALFDDEPEFDRDVARQSLEGAQQLCQEKFKLYDSSKARITLGVKAFRTLEVSLEFLTLLVFEYQGLFIIGLVFFGALSATFYQHHISFRPITTLFEHRISHGLESVALGLLYLPSVYAFYSQERASGTGQFELIVLIGACLLTCMSIWRLCCPPVCLSRATKPAITFQSYRSALLTVPIYVYMLWIAGGYFWLVEQHATGLSIYTGQLYEQAEMFLKVGLYIWLGMLLKRSQLGHQLFDLLRPFGFSPEVMVFAVVLLMAVPTAYTGASGIIIIAIGAMVYHELINSGARRSLALAATAMTGSSGVVLRPCLIIVIVAALNKAVVTADLYAKGVQVFGLSTVILLGFLAWSGQNIFRMKPWVQVRPDFLKALRHLIKPLSIFVLITLAYRFILDAKLDEISAPVILPVILLVILWCEKPADTPQNVPKFRQFGDKVKQATWESSFHIGALLLLMAFSFAVGGVIERAEVVHILPTEFESVWLCMAMLVVLLVGIGMVMDPFGAVVLVSGSLASVAYTNGIAPLHFWMVTLVAFELGYLSPPVALNHLLARQVVGEQESAQAQIESELAPTWWLRHERLVLPICVMAITLVLTAFVPLAF